MWHTELHITVNSSPHPTLSLVFELRLVLCREIASRNPHSFATDVWSLGILIVTLLTGRPPFDTDSKSPVNFHWIVFISIAAVHGTLSKVTQEKYELPTTFSEEAQDLVNSTLRKRPEDRPTILGKFEQGWMEKMMDD